MIIPDLNDGVNGRKRVIRNATVSFRSHEAVLLRLLVNLVLVYPIPGPVQNLGEFTIRCQSAILAENQ